MLRLKINLRVRRSVRVKCPRHPRYNPEREGAGAIRGGYRYCLANGHCTDNATKRRTSEVDCAGSRL